MIEKTFDTGEITLAYLENESSASPLVLLHGLTGWRSDWNNLHHLLTPDWHIYMPELRGHGNSGRGTSYHLEDYRRDVIAFLEYISEPVVLVGFSLGALVALTVAAEYSVGVRALVLIDPPLFTGVTGMSSLQAAHTGYFIWVYETMKAVPSYESLIARCAAALPPDTDESVIKAMADQIYRVAPGTVEGALQDKWWEGVELPDALPKIESPTLLIHGDWVAGSVMRDEDVELVKENLPSTLIVRIPNAGHLIPMEHPDIVLREMNAFLKIT